MIRLDVDGDADANAAKFLSASKEQVIIEARSIIANKILRQQAEQAKEKEDNYNLYKLFSKFIDIEIVNSSGSNTDRYIDVEPYKNVVDRLKKSNLKETQLNYQQKMAEIRNYVNNTTENRHANQLINVSFSDFLIKAVNDFVAAVW